MTRTEVELWWRWCDRRDQGAFRALVASHEAFVYDFARRLTAHAADAEDLAQEAFLELAEADRERPPAVGLRAFLGRRLVLGARMLKRASLTRQRLEPKAAPPVPVHPENAVENREAAEAALAELDPESRQALVLRFLHGLSYAEVAHVLGVKEGAARVRVHRGLSRLRERFGSRAEACVAGLVLFVPKRPLAAATAKAAVLLGGALVMSSAMKIGIAAVVVFLMGGGAALWHVSRDDELVRSGESAGRDAPMLEKAEAEPAIAEREDENAPSGKSAALVPLDTPIAAGKASVSGVLRFRNGTPVAGRQVSLSGSPAKIVETDDQGRFHIHGEWVYERNLAFRGPNGYSLAIGTVKLKADKRVEVDFVLDAGFDLAATVTRSEDGGPISGASVRIYRDDAGPDEQQAEWGWVDTDTGGQFRFRHAPGGEYRLHVVHAGHEAFTKWIRLEGDLSLPIELNEARMLVVKFRNLPPEWRGAKVHLSLSEMGGQSLYLDFEESIDDHDEIRVDAPPPGRYRVELIPGGSPLPRLRYGEYIVTRKRVEPIVFDLPTGARIVGTVTRPDGTPLEKARIEVEAGEIYGRTDADGNFELPFVPKGPNRLLLGSARGTRLAVAHVDVPEHGALRVDVRLRGTATLRGRFVTDAPDWSRTIHLHRKGEEQAIALCRPEGAGFFEIPYLDAGHYELRAWAKDADWLKRPLFLEEGANLDLGEVEAAAFPSFPVRVMVPAGSEMPTTFMVSFHSKDGKRFHRGRMKLKRDGTGFLRGLPEDDGTLQFEASGFALVRRPLTLHKEMPRIEFALKAAPVKLNVAFELAGNDGGPVPRLVVLVAKGRGGTPDGSAFLSFPQGPTRGRLSNLPAGEYTLWIRIDGYKPKDVDVVLAAADQDPIRVRLEKAE